MSRRVNIIGRLLGMGVVALGLAALGMAADPPGVVWVWAQQLLPTATPEASHRTADAALRAALDTYIRQCAPNKRFRLGAPQERDAWAYVYAQELDAAGQPIAEHFIALLAHREPGGNWLALAPRTSTAQQYNALLDSFPPALADASLKAFLRQPEVAVASAAFTGHHLPWPAGLSAYVTQKDAEHHQNMVDLDIQGLAAAGQICASKPGTVVFVKQSSLQGACDPTGHGKENVVVVQHDTGEYSWYLHMVAGSVPVRVGQRVDYGTVLGIEGATGYACGAHLHFMVSTDHTAWTDPADPNTIPWGLGITAVDFVEAPWADLVEGRTCTSANASQPGSLIAPAEGSAITADRVLLQGYVARERALPYAHFIAFYGGAWHTVGPDFTGASLGFYWHLRAAGVPDGPVALGIELCDGGSATLRLPVEQHITKGTSSASASTP